MERLAWASHRSLDAAASRLGCGRNVPAEWIGVGLSGLEQNRRSILTTGAANDTSYDLFVTGELIHH
jgi:hypothetical protein